MTCGTCDRLARELADAREELEAWRADRREGAKADQSVERIARWSRVLGCSGQRVIIAMTLADHPGVARSYDRISQMLGEDVEARTIKVQICKLRSALRAQATAGRLPARFAAIDGGITTSWGVGVSLDAELAKILCAAAGEAA